MFTNIKVGDTVIRLLAESIRMELAVTAITDNRIICGPWTFDRSTGGEIDEELEWDGVTHSGSRLIK